MVEPRIFIFLGQDEEQKQKRLETLQAKILPPALKELNYTLLYAEDKNVTSSSLGEALACLPTAGAKKRLLVLKNAHKLSRSVSDAFLEGLKKASQTVVVLDFPESKGAEKFVEEIKNFGAQVVRFKEEQALSAFDLGRSIVRRQPERALKILSILLRYRDKSEKILGAIFWQWERSRAEKNLNEASYQKGLALILEADKRLKSSSSAFARETLILETLVVKLSYLSS